MKKRSNVSFLDTKADCLVEPARFLWKGFGMMVVFSESVWTRREVFQILMNHLRPRTTGSAVLERREGRRL